MRKVVAALVVLTAVLAATTTVHAQPVRKETGRLAMEQAREQAREQAVAAEKLALAQQILQAREDLQQRGPLAPAFWSYWTERLTSLSLSQLQGIVALGTDAGLEGQLAQVTGSVLADNALPDLGDSSKDLVYTKVAPCRVADTRVAGGALGTGASRNFYLTGALGFPAQGGTSGGCGIPYGPATAVAMNITVVGASGYGWLRAYPYGGSGNASVINYNAGDTIANGLVMPICDPAAASCNTADLTVVADSYGGHVLIDVMGYWAKVNKSQVRSFTVHSGTHATTSIPAFPSCANYLTLQVVAPVAGRIVLRAHTNVQIVHVTGTISRADVGIGTTSAACDFDWEGGNSMFYVPAELPSAQYYPWDSPALNYHATGPGTYTFYLYGQKAAGAGTLAFWYANLTATFHPD